MVVTPPPGALVLYDRGLDGMDYDKPPLKVLHRSIYMFGDTPRAEIVAQPSMDFDETQPLEILLYKLAGGEEHFVYSETRPSHRYTGERVIRIDFFLKQATWGAGEYKIRLLAATGLYIAKGSVRIE